MRAIRLNTSAKTTLRSCDGSWLGHLWRWGVEDVGRVANDGKVPMKTGMTRKVSVRDEDESVVVVLLIDGHNNIFLLEDIKLIRPLTNAIESVFGAGEACQYSVACVKTMRPYIFVDSFL